MYGKIKSKHEHFPIRKEGGQASGVWGVYSRATTAPCASNTFWIFSASSLGRPSLSTCGRDSTNFFAYIPTYSVREKAKKVKTV